MGGEHLPKDGGRVLPGRQLKVQEGTFGDEGDGYTRGGESIFKGRMFGFFFFGHVSRRETGLQVTSL